MDITRASDARPFSPPEPVDRSWIERPGFPRSGYSVRAISRPATGFTGDFYLASQIDDALWFALGDFAGHGLHSAVYMAMVQEELERIIRQCSSPDLPAVVSALDETLREILPLNRFATLVLGRAYRDGRIDILNAGHSHPLILRRSGAVHCIDSHGPVVGLLPGARWQKENILLESGDRLVLYTDGIGEAASERAEDEFGSERLAEAIRSADPLNPLDSILGRVDAFTASRRHDDQTLLILTRL